MRIFVFFLGIIFLSSLSWADAAVQVTSYNVDPSPVIPGEYFTLFAYVTNNSNTTAKGIVFTLKLNEEGSPTTFPFSLDPTDTITREISTIQSYQTVQVQYRVQVDPDALDGSYNVRLEAGEKGKSGGVLPATITVSGRNPLLTIIDVSPSQAQVGETVSLSLAVKNTGNSTVEDVSIGLSEDRIVTSTGVIVERDIVPLGAAFVRIPQILPGETAQVILPVQVNPSASSKAYFVPVTLEFYDSAKNKTSNSDLIGLKVIGNPFLDAYLSNAKPLPLAGQKTRLTIDIYNSGLGPSKFTTVFVSSDFFAPIQGLFFIGTIESDDFDSVVLDGVMSPALQPGTYPLDVKIDFKNEFGETQSVSKQVSVKVYAPSEIASENGNNSNIPLIAGIILVVGLVYWFGFRPKNGNNR